MKKMIYSAHDVSPMKCLICGKPVKLLYDEDVDQNKKSTPPSSMWDDGVVDDISVGYGSKYDGDILLIAICDDCIDKKLKDNSIIMSDNYMESYYIESEQNKYNKWLHDRIKKRKLEEKLKRILK